jgi:hypothetical protein
MQIKEVSVTYGGKLNLGDYNSAHVEVTLSAIADPDESANDISANLLETAKTMVRAQVRELMQRRQARVDEVFAGLPVEVQQSLKK